VKEDQKLKLPPAFSKYRSEIDAELRSVLAERKSPLYDMMRYHLGWVDEQGRRRRDSAGKALRPTLCLLACEAAGGEWHTALPAAAAIELIHNFSLIHDDIQDDDAERRHRPTVWSIWGKSQAINAGDAMHILAEVAILRLRHHGVPVEKQQRAQRIISETGLRLVEGQYLDISYENRLDIRLNDYLEMIERKTASLIACSLEVGALLGTDDEAVIKGLFAFGRGLGLAFQIRDDALGIWGDERKTGKPLGSDIRRRKKSLPIVYALERATGKAKTELLNIYKKEVIDDQDLDVVLRILDALKAKAYAQRITHKYFDGALNEIGSLPLVPSLARELRGLAHFVSQREF
jgi:geranylgeranyl diphosphate synthase type I